MTISKPKLEASDGRGEVYSIIIEGKEFVISITRKGKHRAGHAHKEEAPHYVILGNLILETELGGVRSKRMLSARETYLSKPNEFHIITATSDCVIIEEGGHGNTINHAEWRPMVEHDKN